ncbi:chemotaxis protein CheW [Aquabacterium humicola]|uniref:chemotaxis protein CheW n=1 Tax=Aquabacterium humicola TaxID=3237377 RepID=UPI0032EB8F63
MVCSVSDRSYGIDMRCVQEVLGYERPCSIAGVPAYLVGRIRRGQSIIPIVDLRVRVGVSNPTIGLVTAIVVAKVDGSSMGCVVDTAREAIEVPADRPSPRRAACRVEVDDGEANALRANTVPQPLDVEALVGEVLLILEARSFAPLRQAARTPAGWTQLPWSARRDSNPRPAA